MFWWIYDSIHIQHLDLKSFYGFADDFRLGCSVWDTKAHACIGKDSGSWCLRVKCWLGDVKVSDIAYLLA